MNKIQNNLTKIFHRIHTSAIKCNRNPNEIKLIAVSKNRSIMQIISAIDAGQTSFGENYVQESIDKIHNLSKSYDNLEWHFIGHLQSNKSKLVSENFSWCHTVDRLKIAQKLNDHRPIGYKPLNILIQINISLEPKKSGILINDVTSLTEKIINLPKLKLRGIMAIPKLEKIFANQLLIYNKIANIFYMLQQKYNNIDTLSLGMSNDMESAIIAGSTMIRIGKDIFDT
ncbi:MAG: YggS family pyridoxal phosphate-dependent enzyme [Pantoea sp. Brub]|nr:YggS family pyridoxal phosphate-dependent enzyme [Pantoea sp. Brub]